MKSFNKDPDAVLDYLFDWRSSTNGNGGTDWLESGETISARTVTADTGITIDSNELANSSTSVRVWLSSGTAGRQYKVACEITTSSNRTDERTMIINCMEM